MEVLLDSNFVISCIKKKIDFVTELQNLGFKILLPKQVYQELKDLRLNVYQADRMAIDVAMELFEKRKKDIKSVDLPNVNVDMGLIEMGKKGAYIATLDMAIRKAVPNRVVISESTNNVMVERA